MWRTLLYFCGVVGLAGSALAARGRLTSAAAAPADEAPPQRIASLSPSTTELCAALGLADRLVARSTFCDWPPTVRRVPAVGGLLDPDLERLVSLRPELVLVPGHSRMLQEALAGTGLHCVSLPDRTLEDVYTGLETLGRLSGREDLARRKVASIRRELARLAESSKPKRALRVLLVHCEPGTTPSEPYVAGPGSYLDGLLRLTGHRNALASYDRDWGSVSLETILRADPDVIIEFWPKDKPEARGGVAAAWANVGPMSAVRDGRIHVIVGGEHYIPGPRVARTLRAMIAVLNR